MAKLNYGETNFSTVEDGLKQLEKAVEIRDQMGGAMHWNILNDDCCTIANELVRLGANRQELGDIIGQGNFR